jgi:hypothetical protein
MGYFEHFRIYVATVPLKNSGMNYLATWLQICQLMGSAVVLYSSAKRLPHYSSKHFDACPTFGR